MVTQGSIPHPTTSPFLNLHVRQKEKERLLMEQERLKRMRWQIKGRMKIVNREIKRLLKAATGKEWTKGKGSSNPSNSESSGTTKDRTVIEY